MQFRVGAGSSSSAYERPGLPPRCREQGTGSLSAQGWGCMGGAESGNWLMTAWRKGPEWGFFPNMPIRYALPLPCDGKRLKVTQTGFSPVGLGEGESPLCVMYTKISIQMDSTPKCEKPITQVLFKESMRGYLESIRGERIFLNKMQKTDHNVWGWYIWLP